MRPGRAVTEVLVSQLKVCPLDVENGVIVAYRVNLLVTFVLE